MSSKTSHLTNTRIPAIERVKYESVSCAELAREYLAREFMGQPDFRLKHANEERTKLLGFVVTLLPFVDVPALLSSMGLKRNGNCLDDYTRAKRIINHWMWPGDVYSIFMAKAKKYLGV